MISQPTDRIVEKIIFHKLLKFGVVCYTEKCWNKNSNLLLPRNFCSCSTLRNSCYRWYLMNVFFRPFTWCSMHITFYGYTLHQFSSVTQSCPTLQPHKLQHARPPCPSPTPRVHPNSCASSQWCHPAFSSSVVPFSSCHQSLPASGSFPTSQFFAWGSQSIGVSVSASVLQWTPRTDLL